MRGEDNGDVLILGAGLAGLAAASVLGEQAIVVERGDRAGGLVRSEYRSGFWFDHVIHLLYFPDADTERRVRDLLGPDLARVRPESWVETRRGTTRFPFQMHLGGLDAATITRCLRDLAEVTFRPAAAPPQNFGEVLLRTFGREMCEVFLFPYNRKVWQRPLESLAPAGFTWNITPPDFEKVVQGALDADAAFKAYNSDGFYPRPHPSAPVRGMEVLSRALARRAADLRLGCRVESIDADRREVHVREGGSSRTVSYGRACLATVPLPHVVAMCRQAPDDLRDACRRLTRNRVMSVCLSVRGPRPEGRGFWRYYADESLIFTRLVYMHEFDPATAPNDGWGLLVEIVEPAEWPLHNSLRLLERVRADVERAGALPEGSQIVDEQLMLVDPAYVVFTPENRTVVAEAREFLARHDILTLGRYGRWEYSSMGQVMRDGFALGRELLATRDEAPQAEATAGVAGQ